jgi:molybdopterin/thiamine biosynthesis adenylyltransferase
MDRTVVIAGLGNIGSHTAPLVARMAGVSRAVLCDKDKYDESNVASQSITPGECGRSKAHVQAIRLRRIRPSLHVTAIPGAIEDIPLGRLRGRVILGCVDNRAARQFLSQAARHLGVPFIDAGVHADGMLSRVSIYLPGASAACLECGWSQAEYDALEQAYPCQPGGTPPSADGAPPSAAGVPTGAPAHLGALAAALQATECQRVLSGSDAVLEGSHEIIVDASSHRTLLTRLVRSADCRLADHDAWQIRRLEQGPEDLTLADAILSGTPAGAPRGGRLRMDSQPFVTRLRCLTCGDEVETLRLRRSLTDRDRTCRPCKGRLEPAAVDIVPSLSLEELPAWARSRTLRALGLEAQDIFAVESSGATRYYELSGTDAGTRGR